MKRKTEVRPDDLRGIEWMRVVQGDGTRCEATELNPALELIEQMTDRSVAQALAAGFAPDDADDIASEAKMALLAQLAEDPALAEQPDKFERRRRNAVKTRIFSWRRSAGRADEGKAALLCLMDGQYPERNSADWRVLINTRSKGLDAALSKMSPEQRLAVFLRHGLEWPPEQIAEFTDEPVSTIKMRVLRGTKRLRELWQRPIDPTETKS
jgi:DNA-directed RNA polymerase specialized sigma24 family protein